MNTELSKNAKIFYRNDFFQMMNDAVFGKTMGNVRKSRDIKLITIKTKEIFYFRTKLSYNQ